MSHELDLQVKTFYTWELRSRSVQFWLEAGGKDVVFPGWSLFLSSKGGLQTNMLLSTDKQKAPSPKKELWQPSFRTSHWVIRSTAASQDISYPWRVAPGRASAHQHQAGPSCWVTQGTAVAEDISFSPPCSLQKDSQLQSPVYDSQEGGKRAEFTFHFFPDSSPCHSCLSATVWRLPVPMSYCKETLAKETNSLQIEISYLRIQ